MAFFLKVFSTSAVATFLIIIGVLLNILSLATDNWTVFDDLSTRGLWRSCPYRRPQCFQFEANNFEVPSWLKAVRAFVIIPVILSAVFAAPSIALAVLVQKRITSILAVISTAMLAFFLAVGMIVFRTSSRYPDFLGWSFAVGWVGVGFYIFGTVALGVQVLIVGQKPDVTESTSSQVALTTTIAVAVCIFLGVILNIVSLATDHWSQFPISSTHLGLWRACDSQTGCASLESQQFVYLDIDADRLNVVRAFTIMPVILSVLVTAPLVVAAAVFWKLALSFLAILSTAALAVFLAIGLIVWGNKFGDAVIPLGWSYALGWVAVVFYVSGAVALGIHSCCITKTQSRNEEMRTRVV